MSLSQNAPSPFAVLLRRSKFASYDPKIGQVYTTYGGHAHRGDWGFKRPLPNRRPNGFIFMRRIDTPEQQSEWDTAESSARWIKRWDAMGKVLGIRDMARWSPVAYSPDSDFNSTPTNVPQIPINDVKRYVADMTQKQFERYLEQVRKRRPAFKAFLKKRHLEESKDQSPRLVSERSGLVLDGDGEVSTFASAPKSLNAHVDSFLVNEFVLGNTSDSRILYPLPQRYAGLQYTQLSDSQARYLWKPLPGRVVHGRAKADSSEYGRTSSGESDRSVKSMQLVMAGGLTGQLPSNVGARVFTDFGTKDAPRMHREHGKDMFRLQQLELTRAPIVVGKKPETAKCAEFYNVAFELAEKDGRLTENPYPLGSADYVAWEKNLGSQSGTIGLNARLSTAKFKPKKSNQDIRNELKATSLLRQLRAQVELMNKGVKMEVEEEER